MLEHSSASFLKNYIFLSTVKEDNASWSIKELVAIKDIGSWTRRQEQLSSRMNQKQGTNLSTLNSIPVFWVEAKVFLCRYL